MLRRQWPFLPLAVVCVACLAVLECSSILVYAAVTVFPAGVEFSTIQEAIDGADPESIIAIGAGTYHGNLEITRVVTLLGIGEVTVVPDDRGIPAIRIAETDGVLIYNVRVDTAVTGIEVKRSTCRIVRSWFRTTGTSVQIVVLDAEYIFLEQCTFVGDGIGVLTVGDGTVEILDCEFVGIGTGVLLGGATSVLVAGCSFQGCHEGISLASSVKATLVDNRIEGSRGSGVLVGPAPYHEWDGPLILVHNVILNSAQWDFSLCGNSLSGELSFQGQLAGFGNIIEGSDGLDRVCPSDYELPEGFFLDSDE